MTIPDILVYRHEVDKNKTIFEVIDGQQRSFTILGFLRKRYKNFLGEEIASEKEGFSLTGLTLCGDLNNKKIGIHKNALNNKYIDKILNSKIRIVYIPEKDNPYFSVRDYFTSINKTIIPLKKTSYRYWRAFCDSKIIKMVETISEEFQAKILPKKDIKCSPQQYIMNLAYLFYYHKKAGTNFSVQGVASWLVEFNKKKYELINKLKDEEVYSLRRKYIAAIEQVEQFLTKITNLLETEKHTMNDLLSKRVKKITFTDLLGLYYLLWDINSSDLINNSSQIYNIILEYFQNGIEQNLNRIEKINSVKKYKDRLSFISVQTIEMQQFREKITNLLNN